MDTDAELDSLVADALAAELAAADAYEAQAADEADALAGYED